jgi:hypothetical protein
MWDTAGLALKHVEGERKFAAGAIKPSKNKPNCNATKLLKQHPYGVRAGSIALIESIATRGERTFYGIATFRANLVRFVRLIRTYLHRATHHFRSAHQPARAFHSSFHGVYQPCPGKQQGFSLFSLTFCFIFFGGYGHVRLHRLRNNSIAREILALSG